MKSQPTDRARRCLVFVHFSITSCLQQATFTPELCMLLLSLSLSLSFTSATWSAAMPRTRVVVQSRARQPAVLLQPSPSLSPRQVAEAQLEALARSDAAGAFEFVSPTNGKREAGLESFEAILRGVFFEALLGCVSWTVVSEENLSDDAWACSVSILPAPTPGCINMAPLPVRYRWSLARQAAEAPFAGCWMLEQMAPERPPIDIDAQDATPQLPSS